MAKTPFELKGKTVFVAGHRGMVGGALLRPRVGAAYPPFPYGTRAAVVLKSETWR